MISLGTVPHSIKSGDFTTEAAARFAIPAVEPEAAAIAVEAALA